MATQRSTREIRSDCEKLADIFTSLQRCFMLHLSKELGRGKVSFPQYFLLGFLSQQPFLTMSEVAAKMGHTTAAATGLVDRLENLRLVQRSHASEDRRKIRVQITPAGVSLVARIRDDMVQNLTKLMRQLSTEEQKAWLQIYEKIITFVRHE